MTVPQLLQVNGLERRYSRRSAGRREPVYALNGVSFSLQRGETLGLVGESGSGKSTLARTLLMLDRPDAGSAKFDGVELTTLRGGPLRTLRRRMQMVFQDPYTSLNPRMRIGEAVGEGLEIHRIGARADRAEQVNRLLNEVGLDPELADAWPHMLSGGQRQRVGLARALAVEPDLLICDEPVSALDVSVRAQILALLRDVQRRRGLACLFIAHDIMAVREVAHRVAVMYAGRIVEENDIESIVQRPRHPYTKALLAAVPGTGRRSAPLPGEPARVTALPPGCAFEPRCPHPAKDRRCAVEQPELAPLGAGLVACHHETQITQITPIAQITRDDG